MNWTDDDEQQARTVVSQLYEATVRLTHDEGHHAQVRDFWLSGTPAGRLITALNNASSWQEADGLMAAASGFPLPKE